jgi:hypothetical protein
MSAVKNIFPELTAKHKVHFMNVNVPCHNATHFVWLSDPKMWYFKETWKLYINLIWYQIVCNKNIDINSVETWD